MNDAVLGAIVVAIGGVCFFAGHAVGIYDARPQSPFIFQSEMLRPQTILLSIENDDDLKKYNYRVSGYTETGAGKVCHVHIGLPKIDFITSSRVAWFDDVSDAANLAHELLHCQKPKWHPAWEAVEQSVWPWWLQTVMQDAP
jgi:hypothetical protein